MRACVDPKAMYREYIGDLAMHVHVGGARSVERGAGLPRLAHTYVHTYVRTYIHMGVLASRVGRRGDVAP